MVPLGSVLTFRQIRLLATSFAISLFILFPQNTSCRSRYSVSPPECTGPSERCASSKILLLNQSLKTEYTSGLWIATAVNDYLKLLPPSDFLSLNSIENSYPFRLFFPPCFSPFEQGEAVNKALNRIISAVPGGTSSICHCLNSPMMPSADTKALACSFFDSRRLLRHSPSPLDI